MGSEMCIRDSHSTVYTAPTQASVHSTAPPKRLRELLRALYTARDSVTCAQSVVRSQFATSKRRHTPGNRSASIPRRFQLSRAAKSSDFRPDPIFCQGSGGAWNNKAATDCSFEIHSRTSFKLHYCYSSELSSENAIHSISQLLLSFLS